jgi:mitotic-spindle organizing protein 1
MAHSGNSQVCEARAVFDILLEISKLLNTGLDPELLSICIQLCEKGTSPEALANIVIEIRREVTAISQGGEKQEKYYS